MVKGAPGYKKNLYLLSLWIAGQATPETNLHSRPYPGERAMKLESSQTELNLQNLLSEDLRAYIRYSRLAQTARKAGQQYIADVFSAAARNEREHAMKCSELLGDIEDIQASLKTAIQNEQAESADIYPKAAKVADEEGFTEVARILRKMGETKNSHKEHFSRVLQTLGAGGKMEGKTVGHSETYMLHRVQPSQVDSKGRAYGGELMKMLDSAAGACAIRHCNLPVATVIADDLVFQVPVELGDMVSLHSRLVFTGRTSMTVRIEVDVENPLVSKLITQAITAHFVMIAMDKEGKPLPVPPLIISTEEEKALYEEARAEYEARKINRDG